MNFASLAMTQRKLPMTRHVRHTRSISIPGNTHICPDCRPQRWILATVLLHQANRTLTDFRGGLFDGVLCTAPFSQGLEPARNPGRFTSRKKWSHQAHDWKTAMNPFASLFAECFVQTSCDHSTRPEHEIPDRP